MSYKHHSEVILFFSMSSGGNPRQGMGQIVQRCFVGKGDGHSETAVGATFQTLGKLIPE